MRLRGCWGIGVSWINILEIPQTFYPWVRTIMSCLNSLASWDLSACCPTHPYNSIFQGMSVLQYSTLATTASGWPVLSVSRAELLGWQPPSPPERAWSSPLGSHPWSASNRSGPVSAAGPGPSGPCTGAERQWWLVVVRLVWYTAGGVSAVLWSRCSLEQPVVSWKLCYPRRWEQCENGRGAPNAVQRRLWPQAAGQQVAGCRSVQISWANYGEAI